MVQVRVADAAVEDFHFDIQRTELTPGNAEWNEGSTCALRRVGFRLACVHGATIAPTRVMSLAEHANLLATRATHRRGFWAFDHIL